MSQWTRLRKRGGPGNGLESDQEVTGVLGLRKRGKGPGGKGHRFVDEFCCLKIWSPGYYYYYYSSSKQPN